MLKKRHLIGFVKNRIEETWRGYMYAFTLLVGSLLQTLVTNQYNKFVFVIGLQMKTSIISTIYRKVFTCQASTFSFLT